MAFTANGADAFITNAGSEAVTVFDTRRRAGVAQVYLGGGRTVGAVSDPAGEQLFVTTTRLARHALVVIDMGTAAVVANIALREPPSGITITNTKITKDPG